jgi:hypothetical protein
MVKSIRTPVRPVIFILLLFKVLAIRDPFCITLPRSALRAILDSRQSAHTGVPAILEEWEMPMVTCIFTLLQTLPSTVLIFFILRFILETLPVLVFVPLEEMGGSRPLISDVSHLPFNDVFFFPFLGPIAGIGLFIPCIATWCRPCHIDAKCEIQLSSSRSVTTLYHVHAWERLGVDLHGILT